MGVVNMTPDSFSGDGHWQGTKKNLSKAIRYAQKLIHDGADILDIGGESSRPGAKQVSEKEELRRVIPLTTALAKKIKIPISIDTYKPIVAQHALDAGAAIVNNIMGINPDKNLLRMARNYDAAIVLMHMRGNPQTMQKNIKYNNLIKDIIAALRKSLENCLELGIKSDKIIIDPGIGFGKTATHNLEILNRLEKFKNLRRPVLIGTSRKSFIGKVINKNVGQRMWGSAASVAVSILKGAHIVRVHDVAAMRDVAVMTDAIINENTNKD